MVTEMWVDQHPTLEIPVVPQSAGTVSYPEPIAYPKPVTLLQVVRETLTEVWTMVLTILRFLFKVLFLTLKVVGFVAIAVTMLLGVVLTAESRYGQGHLHGR